MKLLKILFIIFPAISFAICPIFDSNNIEIKKLNDGVSSLLEHSNKCPSNVLEWNELIETFGLKHEPSMVANRGRNNPSLGSFSLFESVKGPLPEKSIEIKDGEFFYGHFTDKHGDKIVLDQSPGKGKLLIELIAWDYTKNAFNFYELRGLDQKSTRWFYRGDSFDALKDNEFLYRENGNSPKFGSRMRCSACHNSGGPIMKELNFPHNDWWTSKRSLTFGEAQPDQNLSEYIKSLVAAEKFSGKVKLGIHKMESSPSYQKIKLKQSLQEQLRPLFCEQEINLDSDIIPNSDRSSEIEIPSAFFINPFLKKESLKLSRREYEGLLKEYGLRFPETNDIDGDHAWLTPVKGYSDLLAIQSLINTKVVSTQFVNTILQIDSEHPLFSKKRCSLLQKVPNQPYNNWEQEFLQQISPPKAKSQKHDTGFYFDKLLRLRSEVFKSEISQNPRGQILEPGFRVIFPESLKTR